MKFITIASIGFKRLFRDRSGLFFILIFPVVITTLIGFAVFKAGGQGVRTGVVNNASGPLAAELVEALGKAKAINLTRHEDRSSMTRGIRRGTLDAGLIIPEGYDQLLADGKVVQLEFFTNPRSDSGFAARAEITSAVTKQATDARAALFATRNGSGDFDQNLELARSMRAKDKSAVEISTEVVGRDEVSKQFSGFNYPSASNLVLFVFITSLTASQQLIESRTQGLATRMLATPTRASLVLMGQTAGRFLIALFQALFIFAVGAVVFDVNWGDPLGTALVIIAFSLVATAMAMLFGSILRTPQQAGLGVPLGIGLGMLGGCMWPLEIVSPTMRAVGHVTPHAWAMDAFIELIGRGGTVSDIVTPLAVLFGFGVVLLMFSVNRFRKAVVG